MSARMVKSLAPTRPELLALIERAKSHKMTPAERREQSISFVYGMLPEESAVTKEQIARHFDEMYGSLENPNG